MSLTSLVRVASFVIGVNGNAFLASSPTRDNSLLNSTSIEETLLQEVRGFMGKSKMDDALPDITNALEPMWLSFPKNEHGNLGGEHARYALHRLFVQRHGWHVDGLDQVVGQSPLQSNQRSSAKLVSDRVPAFLMERFEEAFGTSGLKLQELSILAATLEHIIHDDGSDSLAKIYDAFRVQRETQIPLETVHKMLDAFLLSIMAGRHVLFSKNAIDAKLRSVGKSYRKWPSTQAWLREESKKVTIEEDRFSFDQVKKMVERISHKFGRFQDQECRELKDSLLVAEDAGTGRVKLSDFYKRALDTNSYFKETAESLRRMGALDEMEGREPRVIVTNYVLSSSNCLADTGFYSICCISECEDLLASVERAVAAPRGTPEQIVEVVSKLQSSTVESPRALSSTLVQRLEMMAARHDGEVPLHGRLFSQWMHAAFPRECPHPQALGSFAGQLVKKKERASIMPQGHMEDYVESMGKQSESAVDESELLAQWSHEEELYLPPDQVRQTSWLRSAMSALFKVVFGIGGVACIAIAFASKGMPVIASFTEKPHLV